jgi:NAD(P)-dependent dehydrogenase (short-subunit alcohol dehydrogenase family)
MLRQGHGTLLLTGTSASVKGYPRSSSFAMGKFALRGLAQSLARELQPHNIHVGHIVIDGGIGKAGDPRAKERGPDGLLDPNAIAETYLLLHRQHRRTCAWEIELRPWVENFRTVGPHGGYVDFARCACYMHATMTNARNELRLTISAS